MTDQELKVDNAKRADIAATAYAVKKLRDMQAFKDLGPVEQEEKIQSKKDEVRLRCIQDGNHASIVQQHLGIGEGGGAYAVWDDNNQDWETIEKVQLEVETQTEASTKRVEELAFTIWCCKWSTAYKSTLKLLNKVNTDPDFLKNLPPAIGKETGIYYEKTPPHLYFTKLQLAIWRNFASWNFEDGQVSLPGHAKWYPDGYDTTQYGFQLDSDATGVFKAWEMLREEAEPVDFKWILPSEDRLFLLPPTKESEEFLARFYGM
ncbi:hypothetical protein GMDG_05451 [Pseudogymnoascus destructans 20631-21]|uniref:Uncharacterized protein n=1 Tax=Pseudogymnoascus destructans (strain ATCC MYA-4855 / 20631-21) TaxID=658429 RepID=L8FPI4_PSED2|nr:hypothetical protein GMDG_05451 [Pseudogymnoascus destructans 20631-21]